MTWWATSPGTAGTRHAGHRRSVEDQDEEAITQASISKAVGT